MLFKRQCFLSGETDTMMLRRLGNYGLAPAKKHPRCGGGGDLGRD